MQQRALIEPRTPVLCVVPCLPCTYSLTGMYFSMQTKKAEEDSGVRKACMEAVCLIVTIPTLECDTLPRYPFRIILCSTTETQLPERQHV